MHGSVAGKGTGFRGRYLRRPYGKVDRARLKRRLLERCIAQGKPAAVVQG